MTVRTGLSVRVKGPLASYATGVAEDLCERGYADVSAWHHMRLFSQLSAWMEQAGLEPPELTASEVGAFLGDRRRAAPTGLRTERTLGPMLTYLRRVTAVPELVTAPPDGPVERLLERYRDHLLRERGLVTTTAAQYLVDARMFLRERVSTSGQLELVAMNGEEVTQYVLRECRRRSVASSKLMVTRLRSLLRFLHLVGEAPPLAEVVPMVPGWRASGLPHALGPEQVDRLMVSCDLETAAGRRDHAMLTLLVRLGLRAGEVAALELDDFDWRSGEVIIRGKGNCQERLPLPVDVGEAVTAYVVNGRPHSHCRRLFMRARAPLGGVTSGAVKAAVRSACQRAGVTPAGAHRLRHTAATEMLRAGASLVEVSQVLRHRSSATTTIYARVDRAALRELARPWPGSEA